MKNAFFKVRLVFLGLIAAGLSLVVSCNDDDGTATPPPQILSFTPTSAVVGAEITFTVRNLGRDFEESQVFFEDTEANVLVALENQLVAEVPSGLQGEISVTVRNGGRSSQPATFTVLNPVLTSVSPESASAGSSVTLAGQNFNPVLAENSVLFGTVEAEITSALPTQLIVTVPELDPGTVDVTVEAFGVTTGSVSFEVVAGPPNPSITSITPDVGTQRGAEIVINGTGFANSAFGNIITFTQGNSTENVSPTSFSTKQLRAIIPSLALGEVSVTVTTEGRTSNAVTYNLLPNAPVVNLVSPTSGVPGDIITISGANFGNEIMDAVVFFDDTPANIQSIRSSVIEVAIPLTLAEGQSYLITVSILGQVSNEVGFLVSEDPAPVITQVLPISGRAGAQVTLLVSEIEDSETAEIFIGDTQVPTENITTRFPSQFEFILPEIDPGQYPITIVDNGQTSNGVPFTVIEPINVRTFYWAEEDGDIWRGLVNGKGEITEERLFEGTAGINQVSGVDFDIKNEIAYTADQALNAIVRYELTANPVMPEVLYDGASGVSAPGDIEFDAANDKIYFTNLGDGKIYEGAADGSTAIVELFTSPASVPFSLTLVGSDLYWADLGGPSTINRGTIGQTGVSTIYSDANNLIFGININSTGNQVFFAIQDFNSTTASIQQGNISSESVTSVSTLFEGENAYTTNYVSDVKYDEEFGFLYWLNNGQASDGGSIYRGSVQDGSTLPLIQSVEIAVGLEILISE